MLCGRWLSTTCWAEMSVFDKHTAGAPAEKPAVKGDRHRSQIMVAGTILLVLIAYMTYVKTKANKSAGSGGATVSPTTGQQYSSPMPTATDVPSGNASPTTTVPYAAPTDTTGGNPIPQTSGTPTTRAPSQTVPPVTSTPAAAAAAKTPAAPVQATTTTTTPAQTTPSAYHPASSPALIAPLATPHPNGAASLPGGAGFTPLGSTVHPVTVSKKVGRNA